MAYTETNYRTKKQIKEAINAGIKIKCFQPGLGSIPVNGVVYLEGPHYPEQHKWYGKGIMEDGFLVSIK